jgi:hypothetical protein
MHERQAEKKQEKLAEMERQVEKGTLVIRQMTKEERAELPEPRPVKRKRR